MVSNVTYSVTKKFILRFKRIYFMVVHGHRIKEKTEIKDFLDLVKQYDEKQIECSNHTFFRLSEKQRKVFKCEDIKRYILHEIPVFTGLQNNSNHAVFYYYGRNDIIRTILDIAPDKIEVVTFYIINKDQIPKI